MAVKKKMIKAHNTLLAHIITWICIISAGILLYYLVSNTTGLRQLHASNDSNTRFDFSINNDTNSGFNHKISIYTENGIENVLFNGTISVDGTAKITITSSDGVIIYNQTYSNIKNQSVAFEVTGLSPYQHYTLCFSSDDVKIGNIALTTNNKLLKQPQKSTPSVPLK